MQKLSIIMAVYNAQDTIQRALESLANQTYKNFQLIMINDGSTDKTDDRIKEFCNLHPNMEIEYRCFKNNRGVSEVRNEALLLVKGDYVVFLDADDYVSIEGLEFIQNEISKAPEVEIFSYPFFKESPDGKMIQESKYIGEKLEFNTDEFIQEMLLQQNGMHAHIATKVFKASTLKDIYFDTKITFMEDLLFLLNVSMNCTKIKYIPTAVYHYIQYDNSLSHCPINKHMEQLQLSQKEVKLFLLHHGIFEKNKKAYCSFCNRTLVFLIQKVLYQTKDNKTLCMKYLEQIWNTFDLRNEFSQVPISLYYSEQCCFLTQLLKKLKYDYHELPEFCKIIIK